MKRTTFGNRGVEQKGAALLDAFQHIVDVHIIVLVAGDIVGGVDQIGGLDRLFAKAQVRHGHPAGLFGVIGEIGLGVHVGVVADDLDGALVGADGAVRAQAPELALYRSGRSRVDGPRHGQGGVGDVVGDADGEMVFGLSGFHVVKHGLDHAGREFLGAQAVAAAENDRGLLASPDRRCRHPR